MSGSRIAKTDYLLKTREKQPWSLRMINNVWRIKLQMTRTALIHTFCYFLRGGSADFRRAAVKSHKNLARRILGSVLACNREQKVAALMTVTRASPMGSSIIPNDICRLRAFCEHEIFLCIRTSYTTICKALLLG